MKFITEEDLRDTYRKEPFTTYEIEPGTRLTPGARQFLADRGIIMIDDEQWVKSYTVTSSDDPIQPETEKTVKAVCQTTTDWRKKKFFCKLRSTEVLFLSAEQELLQKDILMAQSIVNMGKEFAAIRAFAEGGSFTENVCCQACTGIKEQDFCCDLGDCFEINEFHMQLEKSKEILSLHTLRCALREIEPAAMEAYEGNEEEMNLCCEIIAKVNKLINVLSQMICMAVGGKECQRRD
ncbi:MAG: hypothetical protein ACI4LO_01095 [Anaerovoracaceae bacterium]